MGRFIQDGVLQLHHVPDVANEAAPTLAEIQAGTELTGFLIELDTPLEGNIVDAPAADTAYNETIRGTYGGQPVSGQMYRDKDAANGGPGADTAWDTLPRGTTGYLAVARFGGSGADNALAVGDVIDLIPIDVATRQNLPYARNEPARFALAAGVPNEPTDDVALT